MNSIKKMLVRLLRNTAARYYPGARLGRDNAASDPFTQFAGWFEMAKEADPEFADAMTLSTSTPDGKPSSRLVLLKNIDQQGFIFYTNFNSRKARELTANPSASLAFWWKELYRQVRVEGEVQKISTTESDEYFRSRAKGSRIGAWASRQSAVIENRAVLEKQVEKYTSKFNEEDIPRPDFWGGYRLVPHTVEFWQGRNDRLHDRLCYMRESTSSKDQWIIKRLSP